MKSESTEVTVRHGYSKVDEVYEVTKHKLDQNGVIKLEYITPVNVTNTTALRIEVSAVQGYMQVILKINDEDT